MELAHHPHPRCGGGNKKKVQKEKGKLKKIATLDGDVEMEKGPPLVLGDIAGAGEPAFSRSSCESTRE